MTLRGLPAGELFPSVTIHEGEREGGHGGGQNLT
jgi:hypothetical protein